jgi:ATP-binding cassette subfamily B protein
LPTEARGAIRFEDVRFAYDAAAGPVLDGAGADIPAGAMVAIVGASGIGKTTLIDLLHRHYDPQGGRILLDGVDLRELDLAELRRRVAVVAQDTVLLPGTIADNIRYARPEAGDTALRRAAEQAQVDAFVREMPEGYDTQVGARGTALSGGQRQRVAIARALLQEPLVLVLDEATSAVDASAEARIAGAIAELFGDRTRLVISHRSEILADADLVLELKDGRLAPVADLR